MEEFNYLSVLTSIILGLGLTNILSSLASVIKKDPSNTKQYDRLYTLWLIDFLILYIIYWWAFWDFNKITWTFTEFLFLLTGPIGLYIATDLLTLEKEEHASSTEEHYNHNRKRFFALLFLLQVWGIFLSPFIRDNFCADTFLNIYKCGQYVLLTLFAIGFFSKKRNIHFLIATLFLLEMIHIIIQRYLLEHS